MATPNPKARECHEANFVYRNKRLLIGWRITENPQVRATAWLGIISTDEASDKHHSIHHITTDRMRVYQHSDGSEQLRFGAMGVDEAHPAILHPHDGSSTSAPFSKLGEDGRLQLLAAKLRLVRNGLWKYSESEGGKLKAFEQLDVNAKVRKRKWRPSSAKQTSSDADDDKDEGDTFVDCEQAAASDSSVTAGRPTNEPGNDHEGDVSMKDGQPEASVDEALSPGLHSMDVSTSAQETTPPLASNEEDTDPARMQSATELGLDVIQQAQEWDLAGSKLARDLNKFQHQLSLASSVICKLDMCQAFFKRMASYHAKITKVRKTQQTALAWTMEMRLPRTVVVAHRVLVDEYRKAEAHVEDTVKNLEERAQALANKET